MNGAPRPPVIAVLTAALMLGIAPASGAGPAECRSHVGQPPQLRFRLVTPGPDRLLRLGVAPRRSQAAQPACQRGCRVSVRAHPESGQGQVRRFQHGKVRELRRVPGVDASDQVAASGLHRQMCAAVGWVLGRRECGRVVSQQSAPATP
jgi:hypothetical protein